MKKKANNKNNVKTTPTPAQIYNGDFENLSEEIVRYLFQGIDATIKKTDGSKDGGYDIVVECHEGGILRKVYFECKLRSDNLNLRDISANLIIAFNEGAIALVVMTNYDYTEQTNEAIRIFFDKTVLNVKLLIGEDIQKLIKKNNIDVPAGLSEIIASKKSYRKNLSFLRIDLDQDSIYKQILKKSVFSAEQSSNYLQSLYSTQIDKARNHLIKGHTICVEGLIGVGKTSLINILLSSLEYNSVHIVANNYTSQSQLLLGIFLDIWGIPIHTIVKDFSDDIIDRIVKTIDNKSKEKGIGRIIRHLIGKTVPNGIADEHYNSLVCDYLIDILRMHRPNISYIFFIENAEKASEEVQILLAYICSLLIKNNIPCIIEKNKSEYQVMESERADIFYYTLKNMCYHSVPIAYMTPDQAREFVKQSLSHYPKAIQDAVLKKGGVRLLTLTTLIAFVKEKYNENRLHTNWLSELQQFTQNDLPCPIRDLLSLYYQKAPDLFHYLYFFHGKFPLGWAGELVSNCKKYIDELLALKFLDIDDSCLIVANELVMDIIKNIPIENRFSIVLTANKLLVFLAQQNDDLFIESQIYAYSILKQYDKVFLFLENYMGRLFKERQYSAFLEFVDFALEGENSNLNANSKLQLAIAGLTAWTIKREINSPGAKPLFTIAKKLLMGTSGTDSLYYKMCYDYFCAEALFNNCDFKQSLILSKPYYDKCMAHELFHTDGEWQEKICITYALSVKELEGNEKAQEIFIHLYHIFPDSFFIQIEYWDHQQCMNFFSNPKYALECVKKVLFLFEKTSRQDYPLPFHEYVDRAMCALCAKQFNEALEYSNIAIRILESNGILPSLGRAYNIKGCVLICLKDRKNAENCFKEACFLLDETNEILYSWRSRLNLIQLEITRKEKQLLTDDLHLLLDETYKQFRNIYQNKMETLSRQENFYTTREYFALLMFGDAYMKCGGKEIDSILADFGIQNKQKLYKDHLRQITDGRIKKTEFADCSYSIGKYIFMVG